jgi:hypothetical protein
VVPVLTLLCTEAAKLSICAKIDIKFLQDEEIYLEFCLRETVLEAS